MASIPEASPATKRRGRPCNGQKFILVVCTFCGAMFERRGFQVRQTLKRGNNLECSACSKRRAFCLHGHEMAGHNLAIAKRGTRRCRGCDSLRGRAYYVRRKARLADQRQGG